MDSTVIVQDDAKPMLRALSQTLRGDAKERLEEVGEFMASSIKSAMAEQQGLGKRKRYRKLKPRYAQRKQAGGWNPNRVLYKTGSLAASWRRIHLTKNAVAVGAAGSDRFGADNEDKAAGNDDRLDVAWNKKLYEQAAGKFLDDVVERTNRKAPRKL